MNSKIIGIGIAAIVVVAVVVVIFGTGMFESPYWETETEFGSWGEEIILVYEDGNTESLKLIQARYEPLKLLYEGKSVNTIIYRITAMATGEGYDEAVIKFIDFKVRMQVKLGSTTKLQWNTDFITSTQGIPIDGQYHSLSLNAQRNFADEFKNAGLADGTYTINFVSGATSVKYWGVPGQTEVDGKSVSLPSGKTITVIWSEDKHLTVVLGAGIET